MPQRAGRSRATSRRERGERSWSRTSRTTGRGGVGCSCRPSRSACGTTSAATGRSSGSARSCGGRSISGSATSTLANNYGPPYRSAEENFGRILASDFRAYRAELVLSTKAGCNMWPGPYGEGGSRKYLLSSLDRSLGRMGLDSVDIFYSHRFDPETPVEETMGALDSAVKAGKALHVGISS